MHVIVLTGGLGAGKSTAAELLREHGAAVICLDTVAKQLMAPGSELLARVAARFGSEVVSTDGSLDRRALAQRAFVTPEAAAELNAIVHPAVAAEVGPALQDLRLLPHPPHVVVLEVPLLAEAPVFAELADEVVAIEAPLEMRVHRAAMRGLCAEEARARIAVQASDAERAMLADVVIQNDGSAEDLRVALERYWSERVAGPDRR
jgi:dephospho-CoA kinase